MEGLFGKISVVRAVKVCKYNNDSQDSKTPQVRSALHRGNALSISVVLLSQNDVAIREYLTGLV